MVEPTRLRHRITRIIAATRFPFVDQETWTDDHVTIVNDETRRYAVKWDQGVTYPSIVITNKNGEIREFGLVETLETITPESIPRWKALSHIAPHGRKHKKNSSSTSPRAARRRPSASSRGTASTTTASGATGWRIRPSGYSPTGPSTTSTTT